MKKSAYSKLAVGLLLVTLIVALLVYFWALWDENIKVDNTINEVATTIVSFDNDVAVTAEVADTPQLRTQGLMHRKEMHQDKGMLFVFEEEVQHGFWMKNTLIPLDMLFLDDELRIVDIISDVPICTTQYCKSYVPDSMYLYVLEVNAGFANQHQIRIGQMVQFELEN